MKRYWKKTEIFDEYIEGQDVYFEFIDVKDVKSIPAADVVEVVRCSECRFNVANMEIDPLDDTDYSGRDIVCGRFLTDGMHPDDYCSYGERRADNG